MNIVRVINPVTLDILKKQELVDGDYTRLDRDIVFAAHLSNGEAMGVLALRPMLYAHTFNIAPGMASPRLVADALFHFTEGWAVNARDTTVGGSPIPYGALFHVRQTNVRMARYIESKGAYAEPGALAYRYDL